MTRRVTIRLVLWYACATGALAFHPFVGVLLGDLGITGRELAMALAIMPVCTLLGAPSWAWLADRTQRPRVVLLVSTSLTLAGGLAVLFARHPAVMIAGLAAVAAGRAPVFPIGDAMTLHHLGVNRRSYGRIRAAGSTAFLVVALVGGVLREWWPRGPMAVVALLMAATVVATVMFPPAKALPPRPTLSDVRTLVTHPLLGPLMFVLVLHGITLATYGALFSVHVEALELGASTVGLGVAVGVGCEVAVMLAGRPLLDRFGPGVLLVVGILSGVPRWWLTGWCTSATALVLTQSLHGVSFGLFWISAVTLFAERSPRSLPTSAQSALPAAMFGGGYLASMTIAAVALEWAGTAALFESMAVLSAVAAAMAAALVYWTTSRRS
jgi:PPP family 3-phenylpropionic acid transporter